MIKLLCVVPTYNAAPWIEECLLSIQSQSHSNFECLVIDDASTDSTFDVLRGLTLDERFTIVRNPVNVGPLANTWHGFERLGCRAAKDAVLTIVDGDDHLAHDEAFATIVDAYESDPNLLLTYGNYARSNDPTKGCCEPYDQGIVERRDFRSSHCHVSLLRTFKTRLWNALKKKDLTYPDSGRFFSAGGDVAYLLPLLDMAGNRFKFIEEIICIYNVNNPVSDCKIRPHEQLNVDKYVRMLPKYDLLP